jgi:hypothetical protein
LALTGQAAARVRDARPTPWLSFVKTTRELFPIAEPLPRRQQDGDVHIPSPAPVRSNLHAHRWLSNDGVSFWLSQCSNSFEWLRSDRRSIGRLRAVADGGSRPHAYVQVHRFDLQRAEPGRTVDGRRGPPLSHPRLFPLLVYSFISLPYFSKKDERLAVDRPRLPHSTGSTRSASSRRRPHIRPAVR